MPWETSWDEVQAMEAYAPSKREIVATDDLRLKRVAHGLVNDFPYVASFWPDDPIPQLPPRDESVRVLLDYRNGPHDPLLWPQRDPLNAPHTAYFERVELHSNLSQNIVGYVYNPQTDWIASTEGSDMGHIRADLFTRLRWAYADVRMTVEPYLQRAKTPHLVPYQTINECNVLISEFKSLATTVREAGVNVTRLQRGIAELRAWYRFRLDVRFHLPHGDYRAPVEYNYVGVFTTDLKYAQTLHRLGVPVWVALRCLPPNFYREHVRESMIWRGRVETRHLDAFDPDMRFIDSTGRQVVGTPTEPLMWSSTAADAVPTNLIHTMPAYARARTSGPVFRLGRLDNAQEPVQRTERSRSPSRLPRDAHGSLARRPSPPRPSSSAPVPADGAAPQAALAGETPRPKRDPDSCKKTQAQTLGLQKHPNDEGSFHNAGRWYWKCPTRACRGVVYSTAQRSEEERAEHEAIYMRCIAEREQVQKMRKGQKEHKAELEDTARKLKDTERKLKDTERELANAQSAARKARIDELSKSLDAIVTPKTSRKRASSTSGSSSIQSKRVKSEPRTDSSSPFFAKKSEGGTSPATSSLGIDSSPTPARAFRATLAKYKASGGALVVSSPTKAKASPKTAATKSKVPIGAKKAPVASSSQIPVIEIFSSDDDEIVAGTSGEDDDYTFADDEEAPPQFYSP
ncbi:hypothetical protein EXIGLDRAFT_781304 [Exidia glandulosa HHB12029]|uniref:Uncharacterized protein n=1 Tax=Exidia glandulosa HHB12029 TaxID=1314781 RepID=A0A165BAD3_EXIGL|nr:hypothetical protein EXIGLDRAFT_781304 [Exidia glandulosa HHB12029]